MHDVESFENLYMTVSRKLSKGIQTTRDYLYALACALILGIGNTGDTKRQLLKRVAF